MVEVGRFPGAWVVAQRALPTEMIGGFVFGMAALTVGGIGSRMAEGGGLPGAGAVTGSALARKMACGTVALMTLRTV